MDVGGEVVGAVGVVGVGGAGDVVGELDGAWPPTAAVIMQMKPKNKRDWRFIMCVKVSTISANVRS